MQPLTHLHKVLKLIHFILYLIFRCLCFCYLFFWYQKFTAQTTLNIVNDLYVFSCDILYLHLLSMILKSHICNKVTEHLFETSVQFIFILHGNTFFVGFGHHKEVLLVFFVKGYLRHICKGLSLVICVQKDSELARYFSWTFCKCLVEVSKKQSPFFSQLVLVILINHFFPNAQLNV